MQEVEVAHSFVDTKFNRAERSGHGLSLKVDWTKGCREPINKRNKFNPSDHPPLKRRLMLASFLI